MELRNAHRCPSANQSFPPPREGDIVVVHDSDTPRGFWKVARITKLVTGKDGHCRGAKLRVAARGEQATTLQRPLQLLYPLEIRYSTSKEDEPVVCENDEHNLPADGSSTPESQDDDEHPPPISDSPTLFPVIDLEQQIISNDEDAPVQGEYQP